MRAGIAAVERSHLSPGVEGRVLRHQPPHAASAELRRLDRFRSQIEEVIRVCKDQFSLTGCQARSERAQLHHSTCGLLAFGILTRERHERNLSIYTLKRPLSFRGRSVVLPALERRRGAA